MPAKVEITGQVARILLSGDVDFSTQVDLGEAIDKALSVDTAKEVQVDMTDVKLHQFIGHSHIVEAPGKGHCKKEIPEHLELQ